MQLDKYCIVVLGPNGPELWPLSKVQSFTGKVDPAPVVNVAEPVPIKKPVAGEPRRLVGLKDESPTIYECTINGVTGLIQLVSSFPDAFLSRGYNLNYFYLDGVKPTGPETANYGNDPLFTTRPEGYRKRYFLDGRLYWEQSNLPDEVDPATLKPVVDPVVSVVVPPVPQPIPPTIEPTNDQATSILKMNGDIFDPVISWKDGMARVNNSVSLTPGPGEQLFVSDSGQPPTVGFPSEYKYRPGDEVSILVYISTSPDIVPADGHKKGYANIVFGNPPQTA